MTPPTILAEIGGCNVFRSLSGFCLRSSQQVVSLASRLQSRAIGEEYERGDQLDT